MRTPRDVSLNIGKSIYSINTPLENDELDRIKTLINDACGDINKSSKQEDVLMLACLRLAYSLDSVNEKLNAILERLKNQNFAHEYS